MEGGTKLKVIKRNAVIITVLLFVCAAVYLNWIYDEKGNVTAGAGDKEAPTGTKTEEKTPTLISADGAEDAGLYYTGEGVASSAAASARAKELAERFASVRLQRKEARDEAQSALAAVAAAEGADEETVQNAIRRQAELAERALKEAELENILVSKGFLDCVVYLTEDSATVTVATETGLSSVSVAKITDVIVSETGLKAKQLRVMEIG